MRPVARVSLALCLSLGCAAPGVVGDFTDDDASVPMAPSDVAIAGDVPIAPRDTGFALDAIDVAPRAPDVGVDAGARADVATIDPLERLCRACADNAECGAGGLCLTNQRTGERVCGAPCGVGCPGGYVCVRVSLDNGTTTNQCVPASGTCGAPPPIDAGPASDVTTPPSDRAPVDVPRGEALSPGTRTVSLGARTAVVYVPAAWRGGGPGLVALHGNGDTASNFLATSGLRQVADASGVALVVPVARAGSGPMGVDWDAYTRPASANGDVTLALDAHALLVGGGADPARVFLLGYSQGGYLAYHVAMAGADRFAAASVVSAGDPLPGAGLSSLASRRIPVSFLIGAGDYALANTQRSRDALRAMGFEVRYAEVPGVGHCCPLTGRAADEYAWLSTHAL